MMSSIKPDPEGLAYSPNHPENSPNTTQQCVSPSMDVSDSLSDAGPSKRDKELLSLFECPVCFDFAYPPILQCQNGHLICRMCRPKIVDCPTCRVAITCDIRNLQMEKLAFNLFFPCRHSGCSVVLLLKDRSDHEDSCPFKPYSCPCPGSSCKWTGTLEQVMPHLTLQHKSITTLEGEDIVFLATDINLSGAVDWVMIQSCYSYQFLLVLEKQEKVNGFTQFFAVVQLIGNEKQASKFVYRLELSGKKRRLMFEGTPRPITEPVQSVINKSDCLIFDTKMVKYFSENGNLGINVYITPVST